MWPHETVFATPWFSLVSRKRPDVGDGANEAPYYSLVLPDYVCIVARTVEQRILLVRQYRPAVGTQSLELPAGMVDAGEMPEQTMRRELEEETGHRVDTIVHLGTMTTDVGRLSNRIWCYWADNVRPIEGWRSAEPEVEPLAVTTDELRQMLRSLQFDHALHVAALSLATMRGYL